MFSATVSPRGEIRLDPLPLGSLGWSPGTLVSFTYDSSSKHLNLVLGSPDDPLAMPIGQLPSSSWIVSAVEYFRRTPIDVPFNRRFAALLFPHGVTLDLSSPLLSSKKPRRKRTSSDQTPSRPPAFFASISFLWLGLSRDLGEVLAGARVTFSFDPASLSLHLSENPDGLPVRNAATPAASRPTYRISLRQGSFQTLGVAVPFQTTRYLAKLLNSSPGSRTAVVDLSTGQPVTRPRRTPNVDFLEAVLSRLSRTPLIAERLDPVRATGGHQLALRLLATALVPELQSFATGGNGRKVSQCNGEKVSHPPAGG